MINDVHRVLFAFWNDFSCNVNGNYEKVPCYLTGHVPAKTRFPYITFDVAGETSFGINHLTAFDWHKAESGKNVNAERAELMDKIAEAIPYGGIVLELPGDAGYIELTRNDSGFQSYYDDPEDESVIGGRTSYQVNYYLAR